MDITKYTGLQNMGNTCYMNSALQILISSSVLTKLMLTNRFKSVVLHSYKVTLHDYYKPNVAALAPNLIKKFIGNRNALFSGHQQQDSHEFIIYFLDLLEEEFKKEAEVNPGLKLIHDTPADKIISILFDCKITSVLKCKVCHYQSRTASPDRFLILPIPFEKSNLTLNDCYQEYLKIEELDDDNKWKCDKCEELVPASKKLVVRSAPKYLIVQLKRFVYHEGNAGKIVANIDCPKEWSLNGHTYQLRGFVHQSGSLNGGHYRAFCYKKRDQQWYCLDDANVSPVNQDIDPILSQAYLLLYVRAKSS